MSLPSNLIDKLVARVKINIGRGTSNTIINDYCIEWINLVQKKICRDHNLWFMRDAQTYTFLEGAASQALPSDFKDDDSVWIKDANTEYTQLLPIDEMSMLREYDDTTEAEPEYWIIDADNLILRSVPDDTYTVELKYWKYLADLTETGTANELITNFSDLLEAGATSKGFKYLQLWQDSQAWDIEFKMLEKDLLAMNNERILPDEMVLSARPDAYDTTIGTIKNR